MSKNAKDLGGLTAREQKQVMDTDFVQYQLGE